MMGGAYGASQFPSLLTNCVLWAPLQHSAGVSGDIDEFPIIPSGVTVTNNGTFTKTSLGNNRSVLNFDGSTNYISLTDNAAWNLCGWDFSIAMWVKLTDKLDNRGFLAQWNSSSNNWYYRYNYSSNSFSLIKNVGGSTVVTSSTVYSVDINVWYYVVFVKSGTTGTYYINGTAKTPVTCATEATAISGVQTIGIANTWMYGSMKDLMIYKGRALTQPEIIEIMRLTNPASGRDFAAIYPGIRAVE